MRFLTNILAKAGLIVDGTTQLNTIANAAIDTDKFLVSDGGVIKYRTGAELASDLGSLTASTLKHQVKLGEAIAKGQAVYVSSADGTNMIVSKASNATEATSSKTLGLLETGGALNAQVNVITEGLLAGLDTSTATAGDPVWLGTNGNLIFGLVNKPSAPAHLVFIGIVTRVQQNNGEIFVKVQNGFELQELHNVAIASIANKDLLMYESATSLWKNKTLGTVIGGVSTQYVKGDGTLGSFPNIGGGGGMVYYLNGSISSGVAGYSQMSRTPVLGAGTDFSKTGNGLICQFLTDANDPSLLSVPSGAWRFGLYASMGTANNNSKFYVEIYKYDGTTFTLIGTSSGTPESVTNGTATEYYTTTVAMSTTALTVTDRIAVKIYATDNNTRTMTIHTENSHLCDIATTFPTGISAINGLITPSQYLSTTTTGTDFTISSSSNTHYFNLPVASATVTGKLSSTDWSTFNSKQNALGYTPVNQTRALTINGVSYDLTADRTWSVGTVTSVGVSVPTGLTVSNSPVISSGTIAIAFTAGYSIPTTASQSNWDTAYNNRITSLTTTGTSGAATLVSNTLNIPQYQAQGSYITSLTGEATASGPGSASVTLTNSAVIGKILTGLNVTGGTVLATDSILTAFGKLQNQVNGIAGGVTYQGVWDASANSPSLTSSVGTKGYYYVVSVAGSTNLNGITDWKLGDWVIFNGNTWEKVDNTDAVVSVNGFTGAVSLTTTNIAEGTNLYYTDTRARAAISLTTTGSSGAATYSGGVLNVPQYTLAGLGGVPSNRTLTINGTAYDLSADRTWTISVPVSSVSGSGAGISVSPTTGAVVVSNTGVTSIVAGTAISISGSTGAVTINNAGVTSVNGNTGAITGIITTSNYNSYSPTLTGGGASGTWGIRVTGFANAGTPRLYASDAAYNYDSANPYYMYMTYDGSRWFLQVNPATPSAVRVAYADAAGNADTVDGYHASTSTIGNYIVVRDGNGYIFGNYINMTDDGNPGGGTGITSFITKQGDNYYRSVSPTNAMTSIRGVASGSWGINITGSAGSASTASQVTINYNNDSNSTYQMLWGSGNSVYGTAGVYLNPSSDYVYANSFNAGDWFRSSGNSGWYNSTYGGGIYQTESTMVRTYDNRGFWIDGGTTNTVQDATLYVTATNNNDWGLVVNKYNGSATEYGLEVRVGNGATYGLSVTGSGSRNFYVTGSGAVYAPVFYDSQNTSYYLDPNSTTSIRTVGSWRADSSAWDGDFSGKIQYHSNHWYVQGADLFIYRNAGGSNVFTINQSGNTTVTGTLTVASPGNYWSSTIPGLTSAPIYANSVNVGASALYVPLTHMSAQYSAGYRTHISTGIYKAASGWTGAWYMAIGGNDSYPTEAFFLNYGGSITHTNGYINIPGSVRSPIFYDSDDTGYYVDPNSNSKLLNLGLGNVTPDLRLSVNGDSHMSGILYMGGTAGSYNSWGSRTYTTSGLWYNNSNGVEFNNYGYGSTWSFTINGGNAISSGSMRAPIFYDSNDTSYYLDPNSDSYLRSLYLGAHDSGTANFFFGEDSSGWYGMRWYWDSGYDFYWYGRNAGTDTLIMNYTTNNNGYVKWHRHFHMNGYNIDYVSQIYQETGGQGNYMYANNSGSYGSLRLTSTRNGWYGIYFDSGSTLMMNSNETGFYRQGYGWQWRWENGTAYVNKNSYGGGTAAVVLDSSNYTSYAPSTTGGGASGTWGINITGSASSSTTAAYLPTLYAGGVQSNPQV